MAEDNLDHKAHREIEAAKALKADILALTDDEDTIRDTLEGATNLDEVIRALVLAIEEDEIMVVGLKENIETKSTRKARLEKRIKERRALIEAGMITGQKTKLQLDIATLSLGKRPEELVIDDESLLPSKFFKQAAPTVDRTAVRAALKAKEAVPGARFEEAGYSLTLSRK